MEEFWFWKSFNKKGKLENISGYLFAEREFAEQDASFYVEEGLRLNYSYKKVLTNDFAEDGQIEWEQWDYFNHKDKNIFSIVIYKLDLVYFNYILENGLKFAHLLDEEYREKYINGK